MKRFIATVLTGVLVLVLPVTGIAAPQTFSDVASDAWYAQAVDYCQNHGLMTGTSDTEFSPEDTMTRAMLATALYRQSGSPEISGTDNFVDTQNDTWYSNAVIWAYQQKIVNGYSDNVFGTDNPITREEIVTILWRMAGSPSVTENADFSDYSSISSYAVNAVNWAKSQNLINGKEGNRFDPKGNATRAEVAQILSNNADTKEPDDSQTPDTTPSHRPGSGSSSSGSSGSVVNPPEQQPDQDDDKDNKPGNLSGKILSELEYIPTGYNQPAEHQGNLQKLEYETWESFSYAEKTQKLTKTAWVYTPYGYDATKKYNVLYLSHGGWSNETTTMGTSDRPRSFKHIIDNAIQDGKIQPLIIVLPTYNNTSASDSGDYSLALQLTNNFHNELINDLIPAVESKYSTYAETTSDADLKGSRDHRAFGGFSMGSMNTWRTFEHCLDYFRYYAPSSGGPIGNGQYMSAIVNDSGHTPDDFFIFAASGTNDFAYSGFKSGVMAMGETDTFTFADNEADGNLSFLEREGYSHDTRAANEYMYNALRFFWNP